MALFFPFGVATPYLQVLLAWRGLDRAGIGLTQGTLDLMGVVAPPLWGYLGDRWQRPRLLMLLAVMGAIPAFMLFRFSPATPVAMMMAAVVFGLCFRPLIPLTDGVTFRYIQTHGGDYGLVRTGGSVAFIAIAIGLGLLGADKVGGAWMIMPAIIIALVLQAVTIGLLPSDLPWRRKKDQTPPADEAAASTSMTFPTEKAKLLTGAFLLFCLVAGLGRMSMTSYYHHYTNFLGEQFPQAPAGVLWGLGSLCEIPVLFFSLAIMKRVGVRNLFLLGILGVVVRLAGFSLVNAQWQLYPLQLLHALTFGAYHAASVTFVSRLAPADRQGTAQTVFAGITMGVGGIIGGRGGGWIAEQFGFRALFAIFAGVALVALVLAVLLIPDERKARPVSE
jgi:PPP family 3-phenylpropionic acid transporter